MKVVRSASALREALGPLRSGSGIGFVPTLGALHAGHISLLDKARAECDAVVMSIYVNPLQFAPSEDFGRYPRSEAADLSVAKDAGVDVAFLPDDAEMYPTGRSTTVDVGPIARVLEGASRPGHFEGVATVVAKLFNLVGPDRAYFGQKDAQQVAVLKRMVRDLAWPVEIVVGETVRERDGLALSSRNAYLTSEERSRAAGLWDALQAGREVITTGGDAATAEKVMWEALSSRDGIVPDYARAVDPDSLEPGNSPTLLLVAATIGNTRLIDNVLIP